MAASEQAQLIAQLTAKGFSTKDLAALTGRTPRYITLARDTQTTIGKGGKVISGRGQNLIPALKALNEKGTLSPGQIPARRVTKAGTLAGVRKGIKTVTTKKGGKQQSVARVKKGPVTLNKAIARAAQSGAGLKWDVNFKKVKTKSDKVKENAWVTGRLPDGWSAQTLQDRIANPKSEEGDTWRAGDVNGALAAIAIAQNESSVTSATGAQEFSLFTE